MKNNNSVSRTQLAQNLYDACGNRRKAITTALQFAKAYEKFDTAAAEDYKAAARILKR